MALIGRVFTPDSPVHLLLYGGLLVCFGLGAAIGDRYRRRRSHRTVDADRESPE
ncbi:hypothetical protein [Natrinema caseinilyticum]|uniref:hypothetical protein n=1 Tax=Natrinema caseinilyticum TaxID=2961570 RepID=UPI0020C48E54|nr:hypothetical protein [Natrinema caseinilyticum]